ncbi:Putative 4,5-dihydroxyphthalate dehydrogenase [Marinomonas gallaica]|uniref:4,5-dihydroxyphthalate dehydrogenase n=1 Tax=Marinomonas gallaica TaxID=1806667 RepID=A0A1C3JV44_9GAMM|nr:Gfo/Idh/MocA family oxidoreductase [Marinomonas gallaica]SBT18950.1 Putative 4,5-dihydroxyphthalate dehydrogenase [Marinomonas gallaica]SBT21905.1 Putative 4,5-dihydroxyphthalate dehydrogenase [Marinomonas gallaica]
MKNILLVGPGLIGKKHIEIIEKNPNLKLVAVVSKDINKHSGFLSDIGVEGFFSLDDALNKSKVDGAIICSPNELHYEHASICIEKNIPTLVEKPLTSCLNDSKMIIDLAENKSTPLLVADHRLYNPLIYAAKEYIDSEKFGNVVSFLGSAQFYKPKRYFEEGEWRSKVGGGPLLINLIHEIGIMRFLCGEISKVSAMSTNKNRGFEVEDTAVINFEFENGALGAFTLSDTAASNKSWEMTTGENPLYPSYKDDYSYHISGTLASLDFPNLETREYSSEQDASWWKKFNHGILSIKREDPFVIQMNHFYDVISNNVKPISSARNGYKNLLVLEAIKESIESGKVISLKL